MEKEATDMRDMNDSGIAWIGIIPNEWSTIRFKYLHYGMNTGEAIDKEGRGRIMV